MLQVSVDNNTVAGLDTQLITTPIGPTHLLHLVISQASEQSGTAHPTPAQPWADPCGWLLADPQLWQGSPRWRQRPMVPFTCHSSECASKGG